MYKWVIHPKGRGLRDDSTFQAETASAAYKQWLAVIKSSSEFPEFDVPDEYYDTMFKVRVKKFAKATVYGPYKV